MTNDLRRLVIITGASRGIGEEISLQTNKEFNQNTLFILIARSIEKLDYLKSELQSHNKNGSNKFESLPLDFSKGIYQKANYIDELNKVLNKFDLQNLSELYVFYNHGTLVLNDVEKSADDVSENFETNVLSVWKFLAAVRELFPNDKIAVQYHINTSSKLATSFQHGFSLYSSSTCLN